ncbi:hypothetical protein A0J61_11887 [Choanephora cucurbitarum]|uniref:Uncharacterized protein n=1 Tax=Choanephora cucurbitarum TaxID=101091 RepID=A0A1C7M3I2_9FUNG|nr:hypothetical protein A0J61_11887 [Choanephora cucurbitarum]
MSATNISSSSIIASDIENNITFTDEPVYDQCSDVDYYESISSDEDLTYDSDDDSFVPESDASVSNTARLSEGNNSSTMETIMGQPVADVLDDDIVHVGSANVEDVEQEDEPELDTLLGDESTSTVDESD